MGHVKRSPLKRKTPLRAKRSEPREYTTGDPYALSRPRRRTRLKQEGSSKYARRPRARAYMLWVKSQPCILPLVMMRLGYIGIASAHVCRNRDGLSSSVDIEADHAGDRAYGRKAPDATVIPLCSYAHLMRTGPIGNRGPFEGFDKAQMATFRHTAIALTQARARAAGIEVPSC